MHSVINQPATKSIIRNIGKTKAYNLSLEVEAVERAKQEIHQTSFSQYLSNLIKKDLAERSQVKTMAQIFGDNFKSVEFKNQQEEQNFYQTFGLNDYTLHARE